MPLTIVATPIGNLKDFTERGRETLAQADLVIGEDRKPLLRLLAYLQLRGKPFELLNEHSTQQDIQTLLSFCKDQNVALVSDCGTPGFSDPGPLLIAACRKNGVPVTTAPGASSLMSLLSLSSERIDQFQFLGFPPQEQVSRSSFFDRIQKISEAFILMDTPYRLSRTLKELSDRIGQRRALLAMDITSPEEAILEGSISDLATKNESKKAEFMLLVYARPKQ